MWTIDLVDGWNVHKPFHKFKSEEENPIILQKKRIVSLCAFTAFRIFIYRNLSHSVLFLLCCRHFECFLQVFRTKMNVFAIKKEFENRVIDAIKSKHGTTEKTFLVQLI